MTKKHYMHNGQDMSRIMLGMPNIILRPLCLGKTGQGLVVCWHERSSS